MDLSDIANITQLIGFSYSTTRALIQLYKHLKYGPRILQQEQSQVHCLLEIVGILHEQSPPSYVVKILIDIAKLAEDATKLINRSQTRGLISSYWVLISIRPNLTDIFSSLKVKSDTLQLAIGVDNREQSRRNIFIASEREHCMSSIMPGPKSPSEMGNSSSHQRGFDVHFRSHGSGNRHRLGNGHDNSEPRNITFENSGSFNDADIANKEDFLPEHQLEVIKSLENRIKYLSSRQQNHPTMAESGSRPDHTSSNRSQPTNENLRSNYANATQSNISRARAHGQRDGERRLLTYDNSQPRENTLNESQRANGQGTRTK